MAFIHAVIKNSYLSCKSLNNLARNVLVIVVSDDELNAVNAKQRNVILKMVETSYPTSVNSNTTGL